MANGLADDGVRSVDVPAEAVTCGSREDFVFLFVIKILDGQSGLLFAQRGFGKVTALAQASKGPR